MAEVAQLKVKKRRFGKKDWQAVQVHIKQELTRREQSPFRLAHERIWKEVDRQVAMKPMVSVNKDPNAPKNDWHNTIELGDLARSSEIITADVRRLLFPTARAWFESHTELPLQVNDETGQVELPDQKQQAQTDGAVRAFMAQQHIDFGLKSRIDLTVHESLHHGSFVVEVRQESAMFVHQGTGIQSLSAPVWVPHSMWNCYPDPSPHIVGTNTLYDGSMIIREYVPIDRLKLMAKGDGWMLSQIGKIPKREHTNKDNKTTDIELVKYFGDVSIPRNDGDIYLPNSKVILANGVIIFYAPNSLPYLPIIYNGYERMDVRDPYYVSPLMKLSPTQKMASFLANKYLDSVALKVEPPILYDGNDPTFVMNGGPVIAPGWKGATKSLANFKTIDIGDPASALQGLQMVLSQIQKGTSSDVPRETSPIADKTATEVRAETRRGEVRVVDFVDKLETSLKTFLYMQHELNKKNLERYPFYNPEMDAPDFQWASQDILPKNVNFEVVGARGVLGEEERSQKMTAVTIFASSNPAFAPLLKNIDLLKEMFQDAGIKNPERFMNIPDDEEEAKLKQLEEAIVAEFKPVVEELQQKNDELEKDIAIQNAVNEAKVLEAEIKANSQAEISEYKAELQGELDILRTQLEIIKSAPDTDAGTALIFKGMTDISENINNVIDSQRTDIDHRQTELESQLTTTNQQIADLIEQSGRPLRIERDENGRITGAARGEAG